MVLYFLAQLLLAALPDPDLDCRCVFAGYKVLSLSKGFKFLRIFVLVDFVGSSEISDCVLQALDGKV